MIQFDNLNKQIAPSGWRFNTVGDVINQFLPYLFALTGFVLLYYLVSAGFSLMFSKGDQRAVEAAKAKITTAVTGFVILFCAYWLVQILGIVFKVDVFKRLFS